MNQNAEEQVLCFDKKYFLDDAYKAESDNATLLKIIHTSGVTKYVPRSEAETSDTLLQLIPYCVFSQKNEETGFLFEKLLVYRRGKTGSEGRLHDKWSLGFGGHINPEDSDACLRNTKFVPGGVAKFCLRRELTEELTNLSSDSTVVNTGTVLYDTSTPVSSVHVGWVFAIQVTDSTPIAANEDCIRDLQWVSIDDLNSEAWSGKLESWASMLAKKFLEARFFHNVKAEVKKST